MSVILIAKIGFQLSLRLVGYSEKTALSTAALSKTSASCMLGNCQEDGIEPLHLILLQHDDVGAARPIMDAGIHISQDKLALTAYLGKDPHPAY